LEPFPLYIDPITLTTPLPTLKNILNDLPGFGISLLCIVQLGQSIESGASSVRNPPTTTLSSLEEILKRTLGLVVPLLKH
jgi:hypothetical protein